LWSADEDLSSGRTGEFLGLLQRVSDSASLCELVEPLEAWLDASTNMPPTTGQAIECLALCHALPELAACLPAAVWTQLLEQLVSIQRDSTALAIHQVPLVTQLLRGELPLTLAYLFPELPRCRALWPFASRQLSTGLMTLLDGEGLPPGDQLSVARLLLACWTRCHLLSSAANRVVFDARARNRYERFVRQSLRLTRSDGRAIFSSDASDCWPSGLIRTALDFTGEPQTRAMADRVLGDRSLLLTAAGLELPAPSVTSDKSQTVVLRRDWSQKSTQFVLSHAHQGVYCELNSNGQTLWTGPWELSVSMDERPLYAVSDWEQVCWMSDADGDYVELQIHLDDNHIVQRHIYLARADNFLILADAFLGRRRGAIEYRSSLPLGPGISFVPESATWEGAVCGRHRLARVLPLALPEWRTGIQRGSLRQVEQNLQWRQFRAGQRLFVPLFWDLEPRRLARPVTWRQLTVAERLVVQDADAAVGFRVQVGERHWLLYRSLGTRGNRTVLGQNFSTEFVLARFNKDAEAEKLIETE
jgi:hypothetical protein